VKKTSDRLIYRIMLNQLYGVNMSGLRVKPTYDNIIAETFKPVKVKYPDRRAETTFNSHLFGQVRDSIDETEKAQQMAQMSQMAMQRAATLSNQSFQSVAASVPPRSRPLPEQYFIGDDNSDTLSNQSFQTAFSSAQNFIGDYDPQRERYLEEQTEIAQEAITEAVQQRAQTTATTREELQRITDEQIVARHMDAVRGAEIHNYRIAEIQELQRHESNVFESIALRERNAERALRRQAEENQLQDMYLRGQLADAQRALTMQAEGNQIHATHLRGQIMNAEGRLMDELTTALQAPVPLALTDEISSAIVPISQPSAAASASAAASSASSSASASSSSSSSSSSRPIPARYASEAEKSIAGLRDYELVIKTRQFLIDQLEARGYYMTVTVQKSTNRQEMVRIIREIDSIAKKRLEEEQSRQS